MRNLIAIIGAFLIAIGAIAVKTCVKNIDMFLKQSDVIVKPIVKTADDLFKQSPDLFKHGTNVLDKVTAVVPAEVKSIPDLDAYWISKMTESKIFKDLSNAGLEACAKLEWRYSIKKKIEEYVWIEQALLSENPEEEIKTGVESLLFNIFTIPLADLGPISVEAKIKYDKLIISVDTPCGTERFIKKGISLSYSGAIELLGPDYDAEQAMRALMIGKWLSSETINLPDANLKFSIVRIDKYHGDNSMISIGQFKILDKYSDMVLGITSFRIIGKWKLNGTQLAYQVDKPRISNIKSMKDWLTIEEIQNIISINNSFSTQISALTDSELITTDSTGSYVSKYLKMQ